VTCHPRGKKEEEEEGEDSLQGSAVNSSIDMYNNDVGKRFMK
jgi:hypothetical protein